MFSTQLTVIRPEEFSRCEDPTQPRDQGNAPSPMPRSDAALKASVEHAIWKDEVLRAIEYHEIDVRVKNGIVHLNGHITNTTSRIRIENAIRALSGLRGLENHLVVDEKLTLEIAGALGKLEHTYNCKFFTGSSHGVVSINGVVSSEKVKSLAEICAAENLKVRAVMNHVRVADAVGPELPELPFLQPRIGATIYFLDEGSGVVQQVIINPNNRRVIAMILLVNFTDPRPPVNSLTNDENCLPIQLVHVPMDTIGYLTAGSAFLVIKSSERSRFQGFDPVCFVAPAADWTPPYPYCPQDILFPVVDRKTDVRAAEI